MSITRPTNSAGTQVIQMPEGKSPPDTRPTDLAVFFNQVFNSLAHQHENGTQEPPPYLQEGGVWARPFDNGRQTLQRVPGTGTDPLVDFELWWADSLGISFPFGKARDIPLEITSLDDLKSVGLYWFATPILGAPSGIPHGNIWVQRNRSMGQDYYYQIVYGDNASIAARRGTFDSELVFSWQDWGRISFAGSGGGSAIPMGCALYYLGDNPLPQDHLLADGSLIYIADHPDAFAVFGTRYGGDGVTTFGLPNMLTVPPSVDGGRWIIPVGADMGFNTRFYPGRGGYVGMSDLYVGQPYPAA